MTATVHGFGDGQRVHHCLWGYDGTVRLVEDGAKVVWDGRAETQADELTEDLAANLRPVE